ncbi:ABC transporter ATP-binding protein [Pseudoalteromonas sp. MMG024]|uniref:ABC transporter ATP-binding protein n=1 Tax=Pseudoalteromonas sp. MMG024 TaxID=2909980 RepID=UPI001F1886DE|nr:ABC transporter ATP-binding protein [Pseudoalteromonas sp. MMG024]MCF6458833.1 ABC transporter ATP-binding protein [Pseudoalteromonas sp. MMG024]
MLAINNLTFSYPGARSQFVLHDFALAKGEHVFIYGPSGSGKSTLLSLITGVQQQNSGSISILDTAFSTLSQKQKDRFRADHIGYIFQQFNLIPFLSATENVALGCEFSKIRTEKAITKYGSVEKGATTLLMALGLSEQNIAKPVNQLSIGQQQRVAAARALLGEPELIIADEPTSALDNDAREEFINQLFEQANNNQTSILFVSHDQTLANLFDRQLALSSFMQEKAL